VLLTASYDGANSHFFSIVCFSLHFFAIERLVVYMASGKLGVVRYRIEMSHAHNCICNIQYSTSSQLLFIVLYGRGLDVLFYRCPSIYLSVGRKPNLEMKLEKLSFPSQSTFSSVYT